MKYIPHSQQGAALYAAGVNYHAYGTLKEGRKVLGHWFRCDKITDDQIASIRAQHSSLKLMCGRLEYAPEITRPVLVFPSRRATA